MIRFILSKTVSFFIEYSPPTIQQRDEEPLYDDSNFRKIEALKSTDV